MRGVWTSEWPLDWGGNRILRVHVLIFWQGIDFVEDRLWQGIDFWQGVDCFFLQSAIYSFKREAFFKVEKRTADVFLLERVGSASRFDSNELDSWSYNMWLIDLIASLKQPQASLLPLKIPIRWSRWISYFGGHCCLFFFRCDIHGLQGVFHFYPTVTSPCHAIQRSSPFISVGETSLGHQVGQGRCWLGTWWWEVTLRSFTARHLKRYRNPKKES